MGAGAKRETPVGEMWIADGVLWHRIDDPVVSEAAAMGIAEAVRDMTEGIPTPAIVDIRSIGYARQEVRDLFGSLPADSGEIATALIVGSSASRAMASLFTDHSNPNRPIRVFTSPAEAVEWARSFIEETE